MENITTVLLSQHFIFWYCIFLYKLGKLRLYLSPLGIKWWICFFLLLKFNVLRTLFLYNNWSSKKCFDIFIKKKSISNRSDFIKGFLIVLELYILYFLTLWSTKCEIPVCVSHLLKIKKNFLDSDFFVTLYLVVWNRWIRIWKSKNLTMITQDDDSKSNKCLICVICITAKNFCFYTQDM